MALLRPDTAFAIGSSKGKRKPREKAEEHLRLIRRLPCLACGTRRDVHAAHLRAAAPRFGKRETGMQEKPSDRWTLPLCERHHISDPDAQHRTEELEFWNRLGIDPFVTAMALWGATGDEDAMEQIVAECRHG